MAWTERYCSPAGAGAHDGTSEANAWTMAEAATGHASGNRVNIIGSAGTYANTSNNRVFATAGTTTAPIWFRGYNLTIGDLDNDFTTARPLITFATGFFQSSGAHHIISNLSIVGTANTGSLFAVSGGAAKVDRVRVDAQSANANARALNNLTTGANDYTRCSFKATTTATEVVLFGVGASLVGCSFNGGGHGLNITAGGAVVSRCVFNNNGADGIHSAGGSSHIIVGNTFYSPASDGIELTALPSTTSWHIIAGNLFSECGVYGINNSSGANTNIIHRCLNDFHASGTANENGFGDSPSFSELAESASPFVNGAGGDFSLLAAAIACGKFTGLFEAQSYTDYGDVGAVQRQVAAGGCFSPFPGQ